MTTFYWNSARLAYAKQLYAANPFEPYDLPTYAVCSLLIDDSIQAAAWQQQVVTSCMSVTLTDDQSGEDNYRWNPWVLPCAIWCWNAFNTVQQQFLNNWLGTPSSPGWVRFFMTWGWALSDPTSNYYAACVAHEYQAVILGALAGVDVSDIATDWQQTRWQNQFLPQMGTIKGVFPEGSDYFREWVSDPLLGWLDNQVVWGSAAKNWWGNVVKTLAYWMSPVAMNRPGGSTLFQVFGIGDDEHDSDATRANAISNALFCFQELCAGSEVAGYAAALLDRLGGIAVVDPVYWLGVQPVPIGDLSELGPDRDCGPWVFVTQSNPADISATRIMIVADIAGGYGHNHADVGSFQALKGPNWLVKEWTEYSTKSTDGIGSGWAEAHCLDSLWNAGSPYGGSDCEDRGFGPLGFAVWFRRGNTVRLYKESMSFYFALGLDLTNHWRTDSGHPSIDRTWVQQYIREFIYLRDLDLLLVATRFVIDGSPQLVRHHVGGEFQPTPRADGGFNLNAGTVFRTLWPQTANSLVTGNPTCDYGAILAGCAAGTCTPALTQMASNHWRLEICSSDLFQLNTYSFSGPLDTLTVDSTWRVIAVKGLVHRTVQLSAPGAQVSPPVVT